mgnify:FL=1
MNPLVLIACLSPIAIIFIVMKLAVFLSGIYSEEKYVESESRKPHGPYVANPYEDVNEEEEEYGNRTDYR